MIRMRLIIGISIMALVISVNAQTAETGKLLQNVMIDIFVFNFDSGNFMLEQARAMDISSSRVNVEVTMKVKN